MVLKVRGSEKDWDRPAGSSSDCSDTEQRALSQQSTGKDSASSRFPRLKSFSTSHFRRSGLVVEPSYFAVSPLFDHPNHAGENRIDKVDLALPFPPPISDPRILAENGACSIRSQK